jgi:site-specific DNA-methyltransferase (adenine-specific)
LKFKKQGEDFIHRKDIPKRTDVLEIQDKNPDVKKQLFKEQEGRCNGCDGEFEMWNLEVDHKIPKSKGGGDYYENYQLLCSSCNRIKGDRPMYYLQEKIRKREEMLKSKLTFGE